MHCNFGPDPDCLICVQHSYTYVISIRYKLLYTKKRHIYESFILIIIYMAVIFFWLFCLVKHMHVLTVFQYPLRSAAQHSTAEPEAILFNATTYTM